MSTPTVRPEALVEALRALDDETMCFDGPATYALVRQAADALEAAQAETAALREALHRCEFWFSAHPDGRAMRDVCRAALGVKAQEHPDA